MTIYNDKFILFRISRLPFPLSDPSTSCFTDQRENSSSIRPQMSSRGRPRDNYPRKKLSLHLSLSLHFRPCLLITQPAPDTGAISLFNRDPFINSRAKNRGIFPRSTTGGGGKLDSHSGTYEAHRGYTQAHLHRMRDNRNKSRPPISISPLRGALLTSAI